ncbi:MAG: prephenate dehydrogenase/arogenate dehydrogenase family protein [Selenomonadaceae bacterium]|nr:prephenate dehydrogenase/arogenate dehydrogenase family protein [Selenomonadaceae bacterium]
MSVVKLAILGVGLIGGSLGLCLKEKMGDKIFIGGYCRTQVSMDEALRLHAVDFVHDEVAKVVTDADIVFLSPPVLQIVPLVEQILPHLKPGAIITDAGSTKGYIWERLQKILPPNIYYIAGHPMTGREKSGVAAAKADLFRGKAYVIVDGTNAPPAAQTKLMEVLRHTEANFLHLSMEEHDRSAAIISHIPHVAAAALVTLLADSSEESAAEKLIGGGFKDTTRIASSNADMWADICLTNGEPIIKNIRRLQQILDTVAEDIETQNRPALHAYFARAKESRDKSLLATGKIFDTN